MTDDDVKNTIANVRVELAAVVTELSARFGSSPPEYAAKMIKTLSAISASSLPTDDALTLALAPAAAQTQHRADADAAQASALASLQAAQAEYTAARAAAQ